MLHLCCIQARLTGSLVLVLLKVAFVDLGLKEIFVRNLDVLLIRHCHVKDDVTTKLPLLTVSWIRNGRGSQYPPAISISGSRDQVILLLYMSWLMPCLLYSSLLDNSVFNIVIFTWCIHNWHFVWAGGVPEATPGWDGRHVGEGGMRELSMHWRHSNFLAVMPVRYVLNSKILFYVLSRQTQGRHCAGTC